MELKDSFAENGKQLDGFFFPSKENHIKTEKLNNSQIPGSPWGLSCSQDPFLHNVVWTVEIAEGKETLACDDAFRS